MMKIQTVTGPIDSASLGRTLMHEHLVIGWPGWESATLDQPSRADTLQICVDRIEELKTLGYSSMVDPCPGDLGRDVELTLEVAESTGFNIICATGLYKHNEGGHAHWGFRATYEDVVGPMTELFVSELTNGIGSTGVKPGILKVGTGTTEMTEHEQHVSAAAAAASLATGVPITTHTDEGSLGDVQQKVLTDAGVDPHRMIIGHSCGTTDHAYHLGLARGGSYLGFDRFGIPLVDDDDRVESLAALIRAGFGDRVVVSHDSVWCWKGNPWPVGLRDVVAERFVPTLFDKEIIPKLRDAGIADSDIDLLTHDNPRRFFEGLPVQEP